MSKVAALWRAYTGVRNYKRIVAAFKSMSTVARGHVVHVRFLRMKAAAVRVSMRGCGSMH